MTIIKYGKICLLLLSTIAVVDAKVSSKKSAFKFRNEEAGLTVTASGTIANSTDVSINSSLLNSSAEGARGDKVDRAFASKLKGELTLNSKHDSGVEAQATLRTKISAGSQRNLSTSSESVKYGEALIGSHTHTLQPRVLFVREAWIKCNFKQLLNDAIGDHSFTVGMFPFSVGRGIAFGDSYAVNPSSLGFYSDSSVDQYAPGFKWSGAFCEETLGYDLYLGLSKNSSTGLKETADQVYDRFIIDGTYVPNTKFARGFGSVELTTAGTLKWTPVYNKAAREKVQLESYAVFTHSNEQKIDFDCDAKSNLGTFGVAGEFEYGRVELGFDAAVNHGTQDVFAWDRNRVTTETDSTTGALVQVYSHLYDNAGLTTKTRYLGDTTAYRPSGVISEALNGEEFGITGKYHANNRFRDAHKNKFKGWMLVMDGSVAVYKRDLKVSATGGIASGDKNPNTEKTGLVRDYKGFISQQESYSGKRVKSVFALGGPLVRPKPVKFGERYVAGVEGFTNIIFAGMGLNFEPHGWDYDFSVNPSILTFWQEEPSKKYGSTEDASNRLGTEINVISWVKLAENLKFKASGAIFLPGKHYTDTKGTAISKDVADMVKSAQGGVTETLPTLGDSTAFTMSAGVEYTF